LRHLQGRRQGPRLVRDHQVAGPGRLVRPRRIGYGGGDGSHDHGGPLMRTRTFALLALAAGLGTAALAVDKPEYKQYASSEGRYKVLFPGAVKSETQELKTD